MPKQHDYLPKLNDAEKETCDTELSLHECTNALRKLANNKSPGIDGLTTDFYKFFWIDIKDLLYNSYIYSFNHNSLSQDQKRGIINLLPKNDKDLRYLANWRPVSLLTTDYDNTYQSTSNEITKSNRKTDKLGSSRIYQKQVHRRKHKNHL